MSSRMMIELVFLSLLLLLPFGLAQEESADSADTAQAPPMPEPLPPPSPEVAKVQQQVRDQRDDVAEMQREVDAIRRFLADRQRAQEGKAPRGWAQPPLDSYLWPSSPESFIPPMKATLPVPVAPVPAATAVPAQRETTDCVCASGTCVGCLAERGRGPQP